MLLVFLIENREELQPHGTQGSVIRNGLDERIICAMRVLSTIGKRVHHSAHNYTFASFGSYARFDRTSLPHSVERRTLFTS